MSKSLVIALVFAGLVVAPYSQSLAQFTEFDKPEKTDRSTTFEDALSTLKGGIHESVPGLIGEGKNYILGKEDAVAIMVRNQPEFSGQYAVGPDGNIQYDFLGDITAEGLTKDELKSALEQKLGKYIKSPEVSVAIIAYNSKFIYVMGAVGSPGKYPMKGNTVSLRDAVTAAGLPTEEAALRRAYIVKPSETKPGLQKVDLFLLLYKGVLKDDLNLAPGDLVVVPTTVPSEINKALNVLLSPIAKGASAVATYKYLND